MLRSISYCCCCEETGELLQTTLDLFKFLSFLGALLGDEHFIVAFESPDWLAHMLWYLFSFKNKMCIYIFSASWGPTDLQSGKDHHYIQTYWLKEILQ